MLADLAFVIRALLTLSPHVAAEAFAAGPPGP